jgi:hypothetical protein
MVTVGMIPLRTGILVIGLYPNSWTPVLPRPGSPRQR